MGYKKHLLMLVLLSMDIVKAYGQTVIDSISLTEDEINTFKEIAKFWNLGTLIVGLLVALLLPMLGFIVAKTNFKNWFVPMVGENLAGKKDDLTGALEKLLNDYQLRKNTKILVVSGKTGINLPMKNFLEEKGFSFSTIGDGFIEITQLTNTALGGANLVLFNYMGQDLSVVQITIGDKVLSLKGQVKVVVAGNERMAARYKDEMGNYLTFSNGYDTLESRIIGAIKQPIS